MTELNEPLQKVYINDDEKAVSKLLSTYDEDINKKTEFITITIEKIKISTQNKITNQSELEALKKNSMLYLKEIQQLNQRKDTIKDWLKVHQRLDDIIKGHSPIISGSDASTTERKIFRDIFFDLIEKNPRVIDHQVGNCLQCGRHRDIYLDKESLSKTNCGKHIESSNLTPCICDKNHEVYPLCKECVYDKLYTLLVDLITNKINAKAKNDLNCIVVCPLCKGHFCPLSLKFIKIELQQKEDEIIDTTSIAHNEFNSLNSKSDEDKDFDAIFNFLTHPAPVETSHDNFIYSSSSNNGYNTDYFRYQSSLNSTSTSTSTSNQLDSAIAIFDGNNTNHANVQVGLSSEDQHVISLPADQLEVYQGTDLDTLKDHDSNNSMDFMTPRENYFFSLILKKFDDFTTNVTSTLSVAIKEMNENRIMEPHRTSIKDIILNKPKKKHKCLKCGEYGHYQKSHDNPDHVLHKNSDQLKSSRKS
jgi:hypothetical protein